MRIFLQTLCLIVLCNGLVMAQEPDEELESPAIERTKALVDEGALPRKAIDRERRRIERERLQVRLRELFAKSELTPRETPELVETAAKLLDAAREDFLQQQALVEAGAAPLKTLAPAKDQFEFASKQLELAQSRAKIVQELAQMARAEDRLEELEDEELAFSYEGSDEWDPRIAEIQGVFFEEFGFELPISAAGDTELHRSLGFDHTGRYDVALHPDDFEGLYLIAMLEGWGIPYIAFRSAVPGQSTGPHIHIGSASDRIPVEGE